MAAQSSIFPIFIRGEYQQGQAFARFQSDAQRAAQQTKAEFQGVAAALDQALIRPRNNAGSLDLGVDQMRAAAAVQQQVAAAAREVAEATKRAATANGTFDQSMSRATRAAFELANQEERTSRELLEQVTALEAVQRELNQTASATDLVTEANRRGTNARGSGVNSMRSERAAFIQLGQQMQDVAVQAQTGTNAFIIFGQQVPQATFALSGLADSANKTKAAVGRFATFLSGPWGTAIFVAIAALGPFVQKLLESGDAAEEAGEKNLTLAEKLDLTRRSYELVIEAAREYNKETARAGATALQAAQASRIRALATLNEAEALNLQRGQALKDLERRTGAGTPGVPDDPRVTGLRSSIDQANSDIATLRQTLENTNFTVAFEQSKIQNDPVAAIREGFAQAREEVRGLGLDVAEARERLLVLGAQEEAALEATRKSGGSGSSDKRRIARGTKQLENFGEKAAESIERINERFDEQPKLIDQAEQAARQLDKIIKDLGEREPPGFEKLIESAENAKQTIADALVRPLEELRQQSDQRLEIEELLAQGLEDQAEVLQVIWQLERQIGSLNENQKADVEDIVLRERERTRELAVQRDLLEAQKSVAATLRNDLTDILSGRPADILGNLKQSLLDLQGQRLFEDIFGDSFRSLEDELRKNTPLGKAQGRLVEAVEDTATTVADNNNALSQMATAAEQVAVRLQAVATGTTFAEAFAPFAFGTTEGVGPELMVTGGKEVGFQRQSIEELANKIAKATVDPLLDGFEDILGTGFAQDLSQVLSGVLAGFIRGGTPGAVLGGAKGLVDSLIGDELNDTNLALLGLSQTLKGALGGAQTGSQVAGIANALGIGLSGTGAQIGGTIGSVLPIPGGAIIGSVAGGIIGKLFGKTPRGSANLTGVDQFSLSGNNKGGAQDTAGDLAGQVSEAIRNIAKQLDAELGAFAVSIGVNGDSFSVDPTGRGRLKKSQGGIDFDQDSAAAIGFAIADAISDGAIRGLSAAEARLLKAKGDIQDALKDVLDFRSVFERLKQFKDPVGAALDALDKEFRGLIDLFERAGASTQEFAQLEELYNIERAQAVEAANDRIIGSLRELLNELTIGDSGLSLRSRRSNALGEFNDLADRVRAGDTTAFDDFANISRQLLDIERELFGSTQAFFDRLAEVTELTRTRVEAETNVSSLSAARPGLFDDGGSINRSIDVMNSDITGWLATINNNIIAAGGVAGGGSSSSGTAPSVDVGGAGGGGGITARQIRAF